MPTELFAFAFDRRAARLLGPLGVRPSTCQVRVDDDHLAVHFGPWHLRTPLDNVLDVEVTGPFSLLRAVGPRLSLADRGVTFGTNAERGVCIRFQEPVPALAGSLLRHPGATVTVSEPDGLAAAIRSRRAAGGPTDAPFAG